jgi:hypothetical protein
VIRYLGKIDAHSTMQAQCVAKNGECHVIRSHRRSWSSPVAAEPGRIGTLYGYGRACGFKRQIGCAHDPMFRTSWLKTIFNVHVCMFLAPPEWPCCLLPACDLLSPTCCLIELCAAFWSCALSHLASSLARNVYWTHHHIKGVIPSVQPLVQEEALVDSWP